MLRSSFVIVLLQVSSRLDGKTDTRLHWQCRRGILELDELLQGYLERRYMRADVLEQDAFRALLTLSDQELFDFFFGALTPADAKLCNVVEQIRRAAGA